MYVRNDEEYGYGLRAGVWLGVLAATAFWLMVLAAS
jgi:hypothetical protein